MESVRGCGLYFGDVLVCREDEDAYDHDIVRSGLPASRKRYPSAATNRHTSIDARRRSALSAAIIFKKEAEM